MSRRCSEQFTMAALEVTRGQLDDLIRSGRITRPTVENPDFSFDEINALATALYAERAEDKS